MFRVKLGVRVYTARSMPRLARRSAVRMNYKLAKPGFWMSALLTLMVIMLQTVMSVVLTSFNEVFRNFDLTPPNLTRQPVVIGLINLIAFGTAMAVGLILNRAPLRQALPFWRPTLLQLGAMTLTVLGADLLLSEVDNLARWLATPPEWLTDQYKVLFPPNANLAERIFLLVLVAPVTEELFFRGVILRGLLSRYPPWAAVLLAALLFGLGHVNPWQFVSAFCIGAAFGWFYVRTRSLALCVLGHAVSNGLFVLFSSQTFEIRGLTMGPDLTEVMFQPWWLNLAGMLLLAVGVFGFVKAAPVRTMELAEPPPIPIAPQAALSDLPPVITRPPGLNQAERE